MDAKQHANTPAPPYYAVIFTSVRGAVDNEAYSDAADRMVYLAKMQPGFLGVDSVRSEIGITISYWSDLESIAAWKQHTEHLIAQKKGRSGWYAAFSVRIARVERAYSFAADPASSLDTTP